MLIGLSHSFKNESDRNDVIETVDAIEYFVYKAKTDRSVDKAVVKGVIPSMVNPYCNRNNSYPLGLRKLNTT